jgi:hypothetical protein
LKEEDGGEKRYKARLVVKGFAQKKGIDFDEIFSPIVKMTSIRTILTIWLQRFMEELGKKQENNKLYCDSQSAIHLAKKSAFHSKTKHIRLRYHFIRSALEDGQLKMEKIHTSQNPADMLTKGVTREKLSSCSVSVGLQE